MRVELNADVYTSDNEKIGTVRQLIISPLSRTVEAIVVERGVLDRDHVVIPVGQVEDVQPDRVRVDLPASRVDRLPTFDPDQFVVAEPEYRPRDGSREQDQREATEYLRRVRRGAEPALVIHPGTDVYGSDGEQIGTVHDIVFDPDGAVVGFITEKSTVLPPSTHRLRVPVEWIARSGQDRIDLNIPSAEAEALSYDVEDSAL